MRQLIIARKDLNMSPGKLSAQVSHASMAFITQIIKDHITAETQHYYSAIEISPIGTPTLKMYKRPDLMKWSEEAFEKGEKGFYAKPVNPDEPYGELMLCEPETKYKASIELDKETYEQWFCGRFTKTICEARNRNHLEKAINLAQSMGLIEGRDYFLIKDACLTELIPEEHNENGDGCVLTCIGFRPLPDDIAHIISKKYQLYKI